MAPRQKFRAGAQDPTGGRGGQLEPLAPGGHGVEVPRPWSAAGISELEERLASCEKAVAHTPQLLERVRAAERRAQVAEQMAQDAARGVGGRAEGIEKSVGALGQALIKAENEVSQLRLKVQAAERLGGQNQILMRQMEEGKAGRHNADIEELKLREEQSAGLLADSRAQVAALRDEFLRVSKQLDRVSGDSDTMKAEVQVALQRMEAKVTHDKDFVEKLRDLGAENVSVTAENFGKVHGRMVEMERLVNALTNQLSDEKTKRGDLEKSMQIMTKEVESGLVSAESKILKRTMTLLESRSKELLRKCDDATQYADDLHLQQDSAVNDKWQAFSKQDAHDKRGTIERLLMMEKALIEEHEGRAHGETVLRQVLEKQNSDYVNAVHRLRSGVEEREMRLREQITGALQKVRIFIKNLEEKVAGDQKSLEEVVKVEIAARMKSVKTLKEQLSISTITSKNYFDDMQGGTFKELHALEGRFNAFSENVRGRVGALEEDVADITTANMLQEVSVSEELGKVAKKLDDTYAYQAKRHYEDYQNMEGTISSLNEAVVSNKGDQDRGFQKLSLQAVEMQAALDAGARQGAEQNARLIDHSKKIVQQDEALEAMEKGMQRRLRGERVAREGEFANLESQIAELMSDQVVSTEIFKIEMETWENDIVGRLEDVQASALKESAGARKVLSEVGEAVDTARALGVDMKAASESLGAVQTRVQGLEERISEVNKDSIAMCTLAEAKVIAESERAKAAESDICSLLDEASSSARGEVQELCADMKLNEEVMRAEIAAEVARLDGRCEDLQDSASAKERKLKGEIDGILLRRQDENEAFKVETRDHIQSVSLNVESFKTSLTSTMKALETSSQIKTAQVQENVDSEMISFRHEMQAKIASIQDELQSSIADSRLFEELVAIQFDEQATNAAPQLREKAQALHKQMDFLKNDFKDALDKAEATLRTISQEQASALMQEADDRKIKMAKVEQRLEDLIRAEADERADLLSSVKIELLTSKEAAEEESAALTEKIDSLQADMEAERSARDSADELHKIAVTEDVKLLKEEVAASVEDMRSTNKDDMASLEKEVESRVQAETDMRQKMETSLRNDLVSEFANREQMVAGLAAELREENQGLWVSKESFEKELERLGASAAKGVEQAREAMAALDERLEGLLQREDLNAVQEKIILLEQKLSEFDESEAAANALPVAQQILNLREEVEAAAKAEDVEALSKKQAEDMASLADTYVPQERFNGTVDQIVEIPQLWKAIEDVKSTVRAPEAGDQVQNSAEAFKTEMASVVQDTDKKIYDLKSEIQSELKALGNAEGFKDELAQLENSMNRAVADLSTEVMAESVVKQELEDKVNTLLQVQADSGKPMEAMQAAMDMLRADLIKKVDHSALSEATAGISAILEDSRRDATATLERVKADVSAEMHQLKGDSKGTSALLSELTDSIAAMASKEDLNTVKVDILDKVGDLDVKDDLEKLKVNTARKSDVEALKSQQELMMFAEQPTTNFASESDFVKLSSEVKTLQGGLSKLEGAGLDKAQVEGITATFIEDVFDKDILNLSQKYSSKEDVNVLKVQLSALAEQASAFATSEAMQQAFSHIKSEVSDSIGEVAGIQLQVDALMASSQNVAGDLTSKVDSIEDLLEEKVRSSYARLEDTLEGLKQNAENFVSKATYEGSLARQLDAIGEKLRSQAKESEATLAQYRKEIDERLAAVPDRSSQEAMEQQISKTLAGYELVQAGYEEKMDSVFRDLSASMAAQVEGSKAEFEGLVSQLAAATDGQRERDSGLKSEMQVIKESLAMLLQAS